MRCVICSLLASSLLFSVPFGMLVQTQSTGDVGPSTFTIESGAQEQLRPIKEI